MLVRLQVVLSEHATDRASGARIWAKAGARPSVSSPIEERRESRRGSLSHRKRQPVGDAALSPIRRPDCLTPMLSLVPVPVPRLLRRPEPDLPAEGGAGFVGGDQLDAVFASRGQSF